MKTRTPLGLLFAVAVQGEAKRFRLELEPDIWMRWTMAALLSLMLGFSEGLAQADIIINQFNNASEASQWRFEFGKATNSVAFDPSVDANTNAASGSLKITVNFNAALNDDNKAAFTRNISPAIDGLNVKIMELDVLVDTNSAHNQSGVSANSSLVVRNGAGLFYNPQVHRDLANSSGWIHIATPISGAVGDIRALTWHLWGASPQNISGTVTLWIDNLVIREKISIISQPSNQTATVGQSATFTMSATAAAPLSYQWQFNGRNVPGATNSSFTLSNVQSSDAENYRVVAAGAGASVPSSEATLTVNVPPDFARTSMKLVQLNPAQLWQRLEFRIDNVLTVSNPFDPDIIRIDANFTLPSGRTMIVPAFWYRAYQRSLQNGVENLSASGTPEWRLRFTPPEPGSYAVSLSILTNRQPFVTGVSTNFIVSNALSPRRHGYVRIAANNQYFETSDGQPLPLIGENVGWHGSRGTYDYDDWFQRMHNAGENFARIWMCPWAFGIETDANSLANYRLPYAWQLDYVFDLAEQHGLHLLLCLDWHGMFAYQLLSGEGAWLKNPYNAANGGPCANQNDFFTDTTARTIYQKRLRYLIGRYGYRQNLLAWEFFNEIDIVYQYLSPSDVASWHGLVGDWLHANDPYGHLVTTSLYGGSDRPEIWSLPQLDFANYHSYNEPSPATRLGEVTQSFLKRYKKPVLIGEFGIDNRGWGRVQDAYLRGLRQAIWGGALSGSVGTGMSWWWENIHSENVYPLYEALSSILTRTHWGSGPWRAIGFDTSGRQPLSAAIGLQGESESLLYIVAPGVSFPAGATNATLPLQQALSVTLTNWPPGTFLAQWFDPATGQRLSDTQASTINGRLTLPLPDFREDLTTAVVPLVSITLQPQNRRVPLGKPVTFSVATTGTTPLTYQWQFNGANIAGATNSSLTLNSAQTSDVGSYKVVVSNAAGSLISAAAVLSLGIESQTISFGPLNNKHYPASPFVLNATASSGLPVSFSIVSGPATISGNILTLTGPGIAVVRASQPGNEFYNPAVNVEQSFTVSVPQPQSQIVVSGASAAFSVEVSGGAPLSYQWQLNSVNIAGVTNAALILTNVQPSNVGTYTVVISNSFGSVASGGAVLVVTDSALQIGLRREIYRNISGVSVSDLTRFSKFPDAPDQVDVLTSVESKDLGENYGQRLSGVLIPPVSGDYTFYIASDDQSQLFIATDESPANKKLIATEPQWNGSREYMSGSNPNGRSSGNPQNRSQPIALTSGQRYYLEVLHKEGTLGDHVAVAWQKPGDAPPANGSPPIPGTYFLVPPQATKPAFATQPQSQTVTAGQTAALGVVATGSSPLSFQWQLNGVNISGATSATLVLNNAQASNAGSYRVLVSNFARSVTSAAVNLIVNVPPFISLQPQSQTVILGASVTFNLGAVGTAPLIYQWQLNGVSIAGRTGPTLALNNVLPAAAGNYSVVVSNSAGSVTSAVATLTINTPPSISSQPQSQTANLGQSVSITVVATGTAPLSYQWHKNGAPMAGATETVLTLTNVQLTDAGNYMVVVSNSAGTVASEVAALIVNVPPSISAQPQSQSVAVGGIITFSVTANGTAPLSYQWRKNGADIPGATVPIMTLNAANSTDAGSYSVAVNNAYGSITSAAATLTVLVAPTITTQPVGRSVIAGSDAAFTVAAAGSAPLSYQWRKDGTSIPGANDVTLTLINVQPADGGNYTVVVTNTDGSTTSAVATLTVNVPPSISVQPQSQTAVAGATVSLIIKVNGTEPLAYQWRKNAADLPGATNTALSLNNVRVADAGDYTVVVTNMVGSVTSTQATLSVTKASQTIAFNSLVAKTYGDTPIQLQATADSGLPVRFAVIAGPALIEGDSVRITGAGKVTIRASQAGDDAYSAAVDVEQSFEVAKAAQRIAFGPLTDRSFGAEPFTVGATASSGLPVSLSIVSGPASVTGNLIRLDGAGIVVVRASQGGDSNYSPAVDVDQTFRVLGGVVSIKFDGQGGFSLVIKGEMGRTFVLEVTNDLAAWTVLEERVNTAGQFEFFDSKPANSASRFYRVRIKQ